MISHDLVSTHSGYIKDTAIFRDGATKRDLGILRGYRGISEDIFRHFKVFEAISRYLLVSSSICGHPATLAIQ